MIDDNKHNLQYFESSTMQELFDCMDNWQNTYKKRFLSISIQQDKGNFCCIALTNPQEVVILNSHEGAHVNDGSLQVHIKEPNYLPW